MFSDPTTLILAALAVLLMGAAKGGLSALGLLALPVLALALPPDQAAGFLLPFLCVMDLFSLWIYRRDMRGEVAMRIIPAAIVGTLAGALLLRGIEADTVRLGIGLFALVQGGLLILQGARRLRGRPESVPRAPGRARTWTLAGIGGVASFLAHAGGPPVIALLTQHRLGKLAFTGTSALIFASLNLAKLPPYAALGQLDTDTVLAALPLLPAAPVGVLLGAKLLNLVPERAFLAVTVGGLLLVGGQLVIAALG